MPHLGFKLSPAIVFPRRRLCAVLLPCHEDILLFIMEMPCEGGFSGELMISLLSAPGREQAQETMTRDEKGFMLSGGQCKAAGETQTRGIAWKLGTQ